MRLAFRDLLRERISGMVDLSSGQIEALERHYGLLLRWNKALNLTRITELSEAVDRHYVESLFLAAHLPNQPLRVADIGSGAGFPGFPVAIFRPDCELTLVEAHNRKAVFLREISRDTPNVRVVASRAEQVHERFDCVVSRAVKYRDLLEAASNLAHAVALLSGREEPPVELGWKWQPPIDVPRSNSRFVRLGIRNPCEFHVEQDPSRVFTWNSVSIAA